MSSIVAEHLERFGPTRCDVLSVDDARAYVHDLATRQYENFSVISWFVPRRIRPDFAAVYAFCRWADDLGDEMGDPKRSLELLAWWRGELSRCYDDQPRHPVFIALHETIKRHDLPREPFDRLIDAFEQDQTLTRYETWPQVLDYCTRSADPVGRLVLYLLGHRDAERQALSDATCTALQLANFWQDVRRDILERDRIYIPLDALEPHGLTHERLVQHARGQRLLTTEEQGRYRLVVAELIDRTWPMFERGRGLWRLLRGRGRLAVKLFSLGGETVLQRITRLHYATLDHRPALGKSDKIRLMVQALVARPGGPGRTQPPGEAEKA